MKRKVIGWNINQRSGMGNSIPQFVIDELIYQDADIIVLTELFKNSTINYFWDELERAGYLHAVTQNDGTNEVGILWKKDLYTLSSVDDSVITKKENNNPNLLLVDLFDESGRLLTIVGYRIRMVDYSKRVEELEIVVNKANEKNNPVLMITDCNNLRRETSEKSWNLGVVDRILSAKGFERHTPSGQSIYTEKSDGGYAYEFAEDHIITRGLKVALENYDRSFVKRDMAAYPWGKDFQIYNKRNGRRMSIKPGFPDHAIVKGYISLEDVIENKGDKMNKIIAVDFDGTLCRAIWPGVGSPNLKLIRDLIQRQRRGDKIILWTCREGIALENAINWCKEYNLVFDAINDNLPEQVNKYGNNSRKISCDVYIDDKSCIPDWD